MSRDDLINYFILSEAKYESFLGVGDAKRKRVISRFAQTERLDPVFKKYEDDIARMEQEIRTKEMEIARNESSRDAINAQAESMAKVDVNQQYQDQMQHLQNSFASTNDRINNAGQHIKAKEQEIADLEEQIGKLPASTELDEKMVQVNALLDEYLKQKQLLSNEGHEIMKRLQKIDLDMSGFLQCPACNHRFSPADPQMVEGVLINEKNQKLHREQEIQVQTNQIGTNESAAIDTKRQIEASINELRVKRSDLETRLRIASNELQTYKNGLSTLQTSIATIKAQMDSLQIQNNNAEIERLRAKAMEHAQDAAKATVMCNVIRDMITHAEQMIQLFLQFKTHLVNSTLGVIQHHANEYFEKAKSSLSLAISGYSVTAKGEIREKISIGVCRNGIPEGEFTEYSAGERGKCELALIYAFQRMINKCAPTGGMDLLFLDEILVNVDATGMDLCLKSLQQTGMTCFVISHAVINYFDGNVLTFVKDNGITTVKGNHGTNRLQ